MEYVFIFGIFKSYYNLCLVAAFVYTLFVWSRASYEPVTSTWQAEAEGWVVHLRSTQFMLWGSASKQNQNKII